MACPGPGLGALEASPWFLLLGSSTGAGCPAGWGGAGGTPAPRLGRGGSPQAVQGRRAPGCPSSQPDALLRGLDRSVGPSEDSAPPQIRAGVPCQSGGAGPGREETSPRPPEPGPAAGNAVGARRGWGRSPALQRVNSSLFPLILIPAWVGGSRCSDLRERKRELLSASSLTICCCRKSKTLEIYLYPHRKREKMF